MFRNVLHALSRNTSTAAVPAQGSAAQTPAAPLPPQAGQPGTPPAAMAQDRSSRARLGMFKGRDSEGAQKCATPEARATHSTVMLNLLRAENFNGDTAGKRLLQLKQTVAQLAGAAQDANELHNLVAPLAKALVAKLPSKDVNCNAQGLRILQRLIAPETMEKHSLVPGIADATSPVLNHAERAGIMNALLSNWKNFPGDEAKTLIAQMTCSQIENHMIDAAADEPKRLLLVRMLNHVLPHAIKVSGSSNAGPLDAAHVLRQIEQHVSHPYVVDWRHGDQENGASFADSLAGARENLQRMAPLSPTRAGQRDQAVTTLDNLLGTYSHQRSRYDLPLYSV
jgi:hypothetical protein